MGGATRVAGTLGVLSVGTVLTAGSLAAQERASAGIGLALALPQGEFAEFVDVGFGAMGHLSWGLDRAGIVAIRLDGGFLSYGRETREVPLSETIARVRVDVTTGNNIVLAGIGPQASLPLGAVRVYGYGLAGLGYFFTESSVSGTRDVVDFASTVNFDDLTHAFGLGGGLRIPLGTGRGRPGLDVGVQYRTHGRTRYLREGSIEETGSGTIRFTPIESRTDLLLVRAGVSFAF